jgi:two-component system, OmpR family, alkaline phosphatase synthesis response regulator PhoP
MTYTVLVTEDDPAVAKGLVRGLSEEGFEVHHAATGGGAIEMVDALNPHILLLDLRLPDINGFDVCKRIRDKKNTLPIIMVTARDEEVDRILGLEIGADDYVVKPFSLRELVSRIRAQLRRCYGTLSASEGLIRIGDVSINSEKIEVRKRDAAAPLTPVEYKLLMALVTHADMPLSRNRLIEEVWGYNTYLADERTVDVHIRHLREKLQDEPSKPVLIQTVRGFGYRLNTIKES